MPTSADDRSTGATSAGISATVAVLFLLLRLLAIADWNWSTAGAIADTVDFGDSVSIVFGTLFARPEVTGILVLVLLPLVTLNWLWPLPGQSRRWNATRIVSVAALVAAGVALVLTFRHWWVPVGAAAVAGAIVAVRLAWRHGSAHNAVSLLLRSVGVIALDGFLVLAAVVDTPWMSEERIETKSGPVEGYVLEVEPGFVKILTAGDREFEIVETGDILGREVVD